MRNNLNRQTLAVHPVDEEEDVGDGNELLYGSDEALHEYEDAMAKYEVLLKKGQSVKKSYKIIWVCRFLIRSVVSPFLKKWGRCSHQSLFLKSGLSFCLQRFLLLLPYHYFTFHSFWKAFTSKEVIQLV